MLVHRKLVVFFALVLFWVTLRYSVSFCRLSRPLVYLSYLVLFYTADTYSTLKKKQNFFFSISVDPRRQLTEERE